MITAGAGRSARVAVAAMSVGVVAALLLVIAGAHVRPSGRTHRVGGDYRVGAGRVPDLPTPSAAPSRIALRPTAVSDAAGIVAAVGGVLLILLAAVVLLRLIHFVVRPRRLRRRLHAGPVDLAPDDLVEQMGAALDDALDALGAGRPVSDAIILCWQRLGAAAEESGIAPVSSDTPEESVNRICGAADVRAEPVRVLAALYREARFSRHALGPADIEAARAALTAILDDLGQGSRATT